jgi:hypothetical protein
MLTCRRSTLGQFPTLVATAKRSVDCWAARLEDGETSADPRADFLRRNVDAQETGLLSVMVLSTHEGYLTLCHDYVSDHQTALYYSIVRVCRHHITFSR